MLWEHASLVFECNDYKKALQLYAQILQVTLKLRNKVVSILNIFLILSFIFISNYLLRKSPSAKEKYKLDPVYTMPVEFEHVIKSAALVFRFHDAGRISTFWRQNFVSISKTVKFVLLPFSNSAGIV